MNDDALREKLFEIVDPDDEFDPAWKKKAFKQFAPLIHQYAQAAQVQTLLDLRRLYDEYELSNRRDLEGNKIATWQGYKFFRNPISDRIEEITGVRSDKEVEVWLRRTLNNEKKGKL